MAEFCCALKITKLRQIAWSEKLKNQKRTKTKTKTKTLFAKVPSKERFDGILAVSRRATPQKIHPPLWRCLWHVINGN